jgi:hypothetical protein
MFTSSARSPCRPPSSSSSARFAFITADGGRGTDSESTESSRRLRRSVRANPRTRLCHEGVTGCTRTSTDGARRGDMPSAWRRVRGALPARAPDWRKDEALGRRAAGVAVLTPVCPAAPNCALLARPCCYPGSPGLERRSASLVEKCIARSPVSQFSLRPGALRSQSGRISRVTSRRSRHRSSMDGRPQYQ